MCLSVRARVCVVGLSRLVSVMAVSKDANVLNVQVVRYTRETQFSRIYTVLSGAEELVVRVLA